MMYSMHLFSVFVGLCVSVVGYASESSRQEEIILPKMHLLPFMAYQHDPQIIVRNIINDGNEAIKVRAIAKNIVGKFAINRLKNGNNSTITLKYQGSWFTLKPGEALSIFEPDDIINTGWLYPRGHLHSSLKICARLANKEKRKREKVTNRYKIFDVGDRLVRTDFEVNFVKGQIKIVRMGCL